MVIDTLDNFGKYVGLNPLFAAVEKFLKEHPLDTLEPGKHPIKGNDLFVNVTTAKGRTPDAAVLETHINMVDIQIPIDDAEKDITKYEGMAQNFVECQPGMVAIFFPQDGHAPCISMSPEIKKAIFKVKA